MYKEFFFSFFYFYDQQTTANHHQPYNNVYFNINDDDDNDDVQIDTRHTTYRYRLNICNVSTKNDNLYTYKHKNTFPYLIFNVHSCFWKRTNKFIFIKIKSLRSIYGLPWCMWLVGYRGFVCIHVFHCSHLNNNNNIIILIFSTITMGKKLNLKKNVQHRLIQKKRKNFRNFRSKKTNKT